MLCLQVVMVHVHNGVVAESASERAGKGVTVDFTKYHPVSRLGGETYARCVLSVWQGAGCMIVCCMARARTGKEWDLRGEQLARARARVCVCVCAVTAAAQRQDTLCASCLCSCTECMLLCAG